MAATGRFDIIVIGTGFASTFFLHAALPKLPRSARVLVLEKGKHYSHQWQLQNKEAFDDLRENTFINNTSQKPWVHTPVFGGGSNCWWGCAPRFMPNDFRLKSSYGVAIDWPLSYSELEPFYQEAEEIMAIAGPQDASPYPRIKSYPQPAHHMSDPDYLLQRAYPGQFFALPSARARIATKNRPRCCASGVCELCPMDAKFTIMNEMMHIYQDPRITLELEASVQQLGTANGLVDSVMYEKDGGQHIALGDLVVLGANALFNPHILLRSGIAHPLIGRRLNEQLSVAVVLDLNGLQNFQGGTSLTGHGYMLYDGEHRARHAACLIETSNIPDLRMERGRYRERMQIKFIFETIPDEVNGVTVYAPDARLPEVRYVRESDYAKRGIENLWEVLPELLRPLPVERVVSKIQNRTEAHILGTAMMGKDARDSVVDRHLVHHTIRNLLVLGGSSFPTSSPANPTLTISALSLWAAHHLYS